MSTPELHPGGTRHRQYRFGGFTLDLEGGFLRNGDQEVTLRPKAFEVLTYLVERPGRLVTKTELIDAVWPDAAITDNSLAQCLGEIRRALNDDSQQIVRTVARRGYVFTVSVTTPVVEFPREPKEASGDGPSSAPVGSPGRRSWNPKFVASAVILILAMVAGGLLFSLFTHPAKNELSYTQITDFTDSALAPVLSPDGKMVAFIRGNTWFLSPDQIYVKLLPNGEPVQLTHDPRQKYGLAFSPDGSRIAYTAVGDKEGWRTFTISPLGGEPRLLLSNAAGLTWIDDHRLLFSQIKAGMHMGIVTATESRSEFREVYFPQHERAMAHYSYASPDRKWALVVEMDNRPVWQPCRLVPLDGSSPGRQVGPGGICTSAGWSPDGKWMYFGVTLDGNRHLWRQRFPSDEPEQITFGASEEDGVAVAPDGRSLITSIGTYENAIWMHDPHGEHPLSSEGHLAVGIGSSGLGELSFPSFSSDGKHLYFLLRRESPSSPSELWWTDLASSKSEDVLPGVFVLQYDISSDGKEVVFSTQPSGKSSQLWLAPLDRSSPPRQIALAGENSPHFGPNGEILFRLSEGKINYLYHMNRDGSGRAKVIPYPISTVQNISADRRWIAVMMPEPGGAAGFATFAVPTAGGEPRRICRGFCMVTWSPDGKFMYVEVEQKSLATAGKTLAIPVSKGESLPRLPAGGLRPAEEVALPGVQVIQSGGAIIPGLDTSTYAFVKTTVHRNLFRIPLR